ADPNPGNNSLTQSTLVADTGSADLALTAGAPPAAGAVGGNVTYSLTVADRGPTDATGVTVTDTLPFGARLGSATPSQGTCAAPSGGAVSCLIGNLTAGGAAATVSVVVVAPSAKFTNSASVSGGQTDPVGANNAVATASSAFYAGLAANSA